MFRILSALTLVALVVGCGRETGKSDGGDVNSLPGAATGQGVAKAKTAKDPKKFLNFDCYLNLSTFEGIEKEVKGSFSIKEIGKFKETQVLSIGAFSLVIGVSLEKDSELSNVTVIDEIVFKGNDNVWNGQTRRYAFPLKFDAFESFVHTYEITRPGLGASILFGEGGIYRQGAAQFEGQDVHKVGGRCLIR